MAPYLEAMSDKISLDDEKLCEDDAWYGAEMLKDARDDIPLIDQLDLWSMPAEFWGEDTPDPIRMTGLVNLTWVMAHTYPDLDPMDYGDSVYNTCIANKPLISDKVQF